MKLRPSILNEFREDRGITMAVVVSVGCATLGRIALVPSRLLLLPLLLLLLLLPLLVAVVVVAAAAAAASGAAFPTEEPCDNLADVQKSSMKSRPTNTRSKQITVLRATATAFLARTEGAHG